MYYIYNKETSKIKVITRRRPYRVTESYKTMAAAKAAVTRLDKAWLKSDFYKEGIDSPNRPIFKYGIAEAEHYHNTIEKFEWVTPMMSETGKKIRISVNTPNYMNPACESYWSM